MCLLIYLISSKFRKSISNQSSPKILLLINLFFEKPKVTEMNGRRISTRLGSSWSSEENSKGGIDVNFLDAELEAMDDHDEEENVSFHNGGDEVRFMFHFF